MIVIGSEQNPLVSERSKVLFVKLPSAVPLCFIKHQSKLSKSVVFELTLTISFNFGVVSLIPIETIAL